METTILQGLGLRDNGKEHGNYCILIGYIVGLYRDNGKEHETTVAIGCKGCKGFM